ncbi:MAG TPA: NAD(P)H-dependent oxidoreductase [Gemmatimonadales bacterium]|nr:NAD(P)H-dependent oxidoreductase [Gemmatimonadales bacterium]
MRLLAFAASLRRGSWNRKLLARAVALARAGGAEIDHADFAEFDVPLYNADVQAAEGIPHGASELARRVLAVDGILLASPEYNYSLPGTIKNLIDWVSRVRPVPLRGKHGFVMAASPGAVGGIRGLWQLRIPLEGLGVTLYPDMFALAHADKAFREDGGFADAQTEERLAKMITGYLEMGRKLSVG